MKKAIRIIAVSAFAIGGLLTSGAASAGGGYSYGGGYGNGYGNGHVYYAGGGRHYRGGRGYGRRHRGGSGAGYAVLGLALGYTLFSATNSRRSYDRGYRDGNYNGGADYYRQAEPYRYAPEPPRRGVVDPLDRNASPADSCLQTREYQTTIIIGGEEKDAYGTACLQPDGSWLQGPARIVPDY